MTKFSLGDSVVIQTHPFSESSNNIIISGEHLLTPPIMLIVEIINHSDSSKTKNENKYKCLWFSTKKNDFTTNWLQETDLKQLKNPNKLTLDPISETDIVVLKSLNLELSKKRSFLNIESQISGGKKQTNSISSHLTFVSPVMIVCDIKDFDSTKLPGGITKVNKIFPTKMVKCKYFNAALEKYSEVLIPIEALSKIPTIPNEIIDTIEKAITKKEYLKFERCIIKPLNLYNKSGNYFLTGFDFIDQANKDILLSEMEEFGITKKPYLNSAPSFRIKLIGGEKHIQADTDVKTFILSAIMEKNPKFLTIKYRDRFDVLTTRTIDNYEIVVSEDEEKRGLKIDYLKAYCNLRKAIRHFKLKNILEVSKVDLDYPLKFDPSSIKVSSKFELS